MNPVARRAVRPEGRAAAGGRVAISSQRILRRLCQAHHARYDQCDPPVQQSTRIAAGTSWCQTDTRFDKLVRRYVWIQMRQPLAGAGLTVSLLFLPALAQAPNTWQKVTEFTGLDQSALSAQQKQTLLDVLRAEGCNCGCTMRIAECRVKDPRCGRSRSLAAMVARE